MIRNISSLLLMAGLAAVKVKQSIETDKEVTKLLVEVSRHGARASGKIYPLTVDDPFDNFQTPYALTQTGADMHYNLGQQYVRAEYIDKKHFLSKKYDPLEVYVQSTDAQRTIDSATAQLEGIFNRPMTFPNTDPWLQIDSIPQPDNFSIHVQSDNCMRYAQVQASIEASEANLLSQAEIRSKYEDKFLPRLRQLTGMESADTDTMFDVQDYLYWAVMSGLNLKFVLTQEDMLLINGSVNSYVWQDHLAHQDSVALPSYEFMQQLLEFSNVLQGANWKDQLYFTKYFHGSVFPKFIFYSAHSETLYPFLKAFNFVKIQDPDAGSALFIEFFEKSGQNRVRLIYKKDTKSEELVMKLKQHDESDSISLEEFQEVVERKLNIWSKSHSMTEGVELWCSEIYSGDGVDYAGSEVWKTLFFNHFGIHSDSFLKF